MFVNFPPTELFKILCRQCLSGCILDTFSDKQLHFLSRGVFGTQSNMYDEVLNWVLNASPLSFIS